MVASPICKSLFLQWPIFSKMGIFGRNTSQITQTLNYKRQTTSHGLSGKTDLKVLYEVTFQLLPNQYSILCIIFAYFLLDGNLW